MTAAAALTYRFAYPMAGATTTRTVYNYSDTSVFTNNKNTTASGNAIIMLSTTDPSNLSSVTPTAMGRFASGSFRPVTAPDGSMYVAGVITNSLPGTLYNAAGTAVFTMPNPLYSTNDTFGAKFNSNGVPLWYVRLLSINADNTSFATTDSSSFLYVCGNRTQTSGRNEFSIFNSDGTFTNIQNYTISSNVDFFAVVFNTAGFMSSYMLIESLLLEAAYTMIVDDTSSSIYIAGSLNINSTTSPSIVRDFNGNSYAFNHNGDTSILSDGSDTWLFRMNKAGTSGTQWTAWISGATGNEERPTYVALLPDGIRNDPVITSNGRNRLIVYNADGSVFCNVLPNVVIATNFLSVVVRYNATTGAPIWAIGFDHGSAAVDCRLTCTSGLAVYVYIRSLLITVNKTYGQSPTIIDNNVNVLAMGNPPSQAIMKFVDGVYQWVIYFNVANAGGVSVNIETVNDQVFATLRFTGQFSFTGPVNSLTTPLFTGGILVTMVVHIAPNGFVTIISYVRTFL